MKSQLNTKEVRMRSKGCPLWLERMRTTLKPDRYAPLFSMSLPDLRSYFASNDGPRQIALNLQKRSGLIDSRSVSIMLPHVRLEVNSDTGKKVPTTISCSVLFLILLECVKGLFVMKEEETILFYDMFGTVSKLRVICSAFYFTMFDGWPALQEEFFKQLQRYLVSQPEPGMFLRSSLKLRKILQAVDPRSSRMPDNSFDYRAAAKIGTSFLNDKLIEHLRYHCVPYLIMLWYNDQVILENSIKDVDGIPSLCGFATYLDKSFGNTMTAKLADRNKVIMMFYEGDKIPIWNMLPDRIGSKNLERYLHLTALRRVAREKKVIMGELLCAPAELLEGPWPCSSAVGSLKDYLLNSLYIGDEVFPMPPIRFTKDLPYKLIVEITLPMRLLLYMSVDDQGIATWKPRFDCYTMTITTGMLTTATCFDNIPPNFNIYDSNGTALNREHTNGEPNFLIRDQSLTAKFFKMWTEVLISYQANTEGLNGFREAVNELPIFRNFVMVEKSIKRLLDNSVCCDHYINEDTIWNNSPLHDDWGNTNQYPPNYLIDPDAEFVNQFVTQIGKDPIELPRSQWASSTIFLLDVDRYDPNYLLELGEKSYDLKILPSNIPSVIKHVTDQARLDWSRHKFPNIPKAFRAMKETLLSESKTQSVRGDRSGKKKRVSLNGVGDISEFFDSIPPLARPAPSPVPAASTSRQQTQTSISGVGDIKNLFTSL